MLVGRRSSLLRPVQDLPALIRELGLAPVARDVREEDGLEGRAFLLACGWIPGRMPGSRTLVLLCIVIPVRRFRSFFTR